MPTPLLRAIYSPLSTVLEMSPQEEFKRSHVNSIASQSLRHLLFCLTLLCGTLCNVVSASDMLIQASPYLRAHANDAVKWRPFGQAAFAEAKQHDKPILLSSGYLSCYWCYRMAEDSFRKRRIGNHVNQYFIPVLLDRELEPEVDTYLQTFMTRQRGFGGWPLTVILTPDAKPVAGVSYQAADDFMQTLQSFQNHWDRQRNAVQQSALKKHRDVLAETVPKPSPRAFKMGDALNAFTSHADQLIDPTFGGFGRAEKFPYAPQLALTLYLDIQDRTTDFGGLVDLSLQGLIGGGLRDHVGGGFFRYSDTDDWSTPHFEQMLYTQALLASLLLEAGVGYKKAGYIQAADEVLLGMINHFQREDGLFRAGLSALDENGRAGGYYLWSEKQLKDILGKDLNTIYALPLGTPSYHLPLIKVTGSHRLRIRQRLLAARQHRSQKTDDKALLGWNGLALSALAHARALNPAIQQAGEALFKKLSPYLYKQRLPRLIDYPKAGDAQFTDKVYLAYGLHAWTQVTGNAQLRVALSTFMYNLYQQHYHEGLWKVATDKPLLGDLRTPALIDTQLPSPTGLWLQITGELLNGFYDAGLSPESHESIQSLESAFKRVAEQLPESLTENAFFHATTIKALINDTLLKHQRKPPLE